MSFGRRASPPPPPPPSPPGPDGLPIGPISNALDGVIRRLTAVLCLYDFDCGALGDPAPVEGNASARLAESLCFEVDGDQHFAALYQTEDFKALICKPHYRVFMMTSALGIADALTDGLLGEEARAVAGSQLPPEVAPEIA